MSENKKSEREIKELCRERDDYPFIIADYYGSGVVGKKHMTTVSSNSPRVLTLKISTFIGSDEEAIHYYGMLCSDGAEIRVIGTDVSATYFSIANGETEEDAEKLKTAERGIKMELLRYITDEERELMPGRFMDFEKTTNAWNSKEELIEFAKEVFNTRFVGKWHFEVEDNCRSFFL